MKKTQVTDKNTQNPDDTKKPRSSGKNPAVATLNTGSKVFGWRFKDVMET